MTLLGPWKKSPLNDISFDSGSEPAMPVGAEPDGEDGVPEHPQGAVQRRRAQAGVRDGAQDAVRGPHLPTGLLVQESNHRNPLNYRGQSP